MKKMKDNLIKIFSMCEYGNGILLLKPIMYQGADHSFSFYVEKRGNGFTVSDRGETLEYLSENLNPGIYAERIEAVCERFEITLTDGAFYGRLASIESGQTMRNLFKFIGAMNMIANIDAF